MACNSNSNSHGRNRRLLLPGTTSIAAIMLLLLMPIKAADSGYGYKPDSLEKPGAPPQYHKQRMLSTIIGVQGIIYCRSGTKLTPLGGALARISCLAIDTRGYETAPFVILSGPTDANGYFFATLSPSEVEANWRLSECKAFLHSSPDASCAHPTDVNRGVSGALLSSYSRRRGNGKMKLYTVGPFLYAPGPSGH